MAGDANYVELFKRLPSSGVKETPSRLSRLRRKVNKLLGRPSTSEVGILSTILSSLAVQTEAKLNQTIDKVVVTTPFFPALTDKDLNDALEYAGLRSWLVYPLPYPKMIYTSNAAFAGNGQGLCTHWDHLYACHDELEEGLIPRHRLFSVR